MDVSRARYVTIDGGWGPIHLRPDPELVACVAVFRAWDEPFFHSRWWGRGGPPDPGDDLWRAFVPTKPPPRVIPTGLDLDTGVIETVVLYRRRVRWDNVQAWVYAELDDDRVPAQLELFMLAMRLLERIVAARPLPDPC